MLVVALGLGTVAAVPAAAASGPSGSPILIGQIETQTGSAAATGKVTTAQDGLNAWVKWTNAHGGVAGHPVSVKTIDDKGDPAASQAALKQLIEGDKVVAIVGQAASSEPTWKDYIATAGTPVIGGPAYSANWFSQPLFYPVTDSVISNIYGFVQAGATAGKKSFASLLCSNLTVCQAARAITTDAAQQLGMKVVYDGTADSAAPNYTPQCLAMKEAGADMISPQGINLPNLIRDCSRQGYKPLIVSTVYQLTLDTIKKNPGLAGVRGSGPNMSPYNEYPATKDYFAAMKKYAPKYAPGGSVYETGSPMNAMNAWLAGEAFKKAVENSGVSANDTVTRQNVIKGLSMFKGETLNGQMPPLTYSDGTTTPNPQQKCYYLYTITKTGYKEDLQGKSPKVYCQP